MIFFKQHLNSKKIWFAWYPVHCVEDECWAWLQKVERTNTLGIYRKPLSGRCYVLSTYKLIKDD